MIKKIKEIGKIKDILKKANGKITAAPYLYRHYEIDYKGLQLFDNGSIIVYYVGGLHSDDLPSNHYFGIRRRKLDSLPDDIIIKLYKSLIGEIKHWNYLKKSRKGKQLRLKLRTPRAKQLKLYE